MRYLTSLGLAALPLLQVANGFVPSSIEKSVYNTSSPSDPNYQTTSRTYFDGLGRQIRSVDQEGAGDVISGILYDDAGRAIKTVKPYYSLSHSHGWKNATYADLEGESNLYYDNSTPARPSAGGYPYSETVYFQDPLSRAKSLSSPGLAFNTASGRVKRSWTIGLDAPNFVANPTDAILDAMMNGSNAKYILEVSRNEDYRFNQTIKDNFGHVLKTWSDPSTTAGDEIVTENSYDMEGRLIKTLLPGTSGAVDPNMTVTRKYSTDGLLLEESYPDESTTRYVYDATGRLRMKQDAKDANSGNGQSAFTYFKYDENGRKIEEGTVTGFALSLVYYMSSTFANDPTFPVATSGVTFTPKKRWYYDSFSEFDPNISIPMGVPSGFDTRSHGKLVATVAYNDAVGVGSQVMKFFHYDDEGRLSNLHVAIPEVPLQEFEYRYDLQGRLVQKYHYRYDGNSWRFTGTEYAYDAKGRMTRAALDGAKDIQYSYETNGNFLKKTIGNMVTDSRKYTIRDWLQAIDVQNIGSSSAWLYREGLTYESAPSSPMNQFSGNISSATHALYSGGAVVSNIGHGYTYDGANRLTSTGFTPEFQETFTYNSKGSLTSKRENGVTKGPYTFYSNTNRIARSTYDPITTNPPSEYFYDSRGNMIYDRIKKLAIYYDYDNMPFRFRVYNSAPPEGNWYGGTDIKTDVEMLYDADGKRVVKRTVNY